MRCVRNEKKILLWSDIISHSKGVILNIIYLIPCWSNLWKLPCDNDKPNKYLKPQKNPKLNQRTVLLRNFTECYYLHWTSTKWKFELQKNRCKTHKRSVDRKKFGNKILSWGSATSLILNRVTTVMSNPMNLLKWDN